MRRPLAALLGLALLVAACGDDDTTAGDTTTTTTDATTTTPDGTTTSTAAPTSTTSGGGGGELPGERLEIFPYEGASLAVVGVAADDTLNVRAAPGVDGEVVYDLDPLAEGLTATGHNRMLDESGLWAEIEGPAGTGWANAAFLAQPGQVLDITSQVAPTPADRPTAETMLALGEAVAAMRASEEPPSEITVVEAPTVGDLGEITVDVIGLGDDAVAGERLHVFGEPDPGGESFTLRTVEATILCARGVTADGLCV